MRACWPSSIRLPPSNLTGQQPVTPRALLSHTSGATDGFGFPGNALGGTLPSLVQILQVSRPPIGARLCSPDRPTSATSITAGVLW